MVCGDAAVSVLNAGFIANISASRSAWQECLFAQKHR
jgi:hypothetical protein